jgi:hypothetical protein
MKLMSQIRLPLVVLPFFYACATSTVKPPTTADDADTKTESHDSAKPDDDATLASKPVDSEKDDSSVKKEEAKSDKKPAAKGDNDDSAEPAPKDDSRTTASCEKVIKDNRPGFKKCYKGRTELKGEIVLQIELDAAGKIKKAYIDQESTIKDQKVHDCILDFAKTLTYPSSTKGLDKNFEYTFGINNG